MTGQRSETRQALDGIRERAAKRAYGRIYPTCLWENASTTGRQDAFEAMSAADVLAVIETDLTLAQAVVSGRTNVAGGES